MRMDGLMQVFSLMNGIHTSQYAHSALPYFSPRCDYRELPEWPLSCWCAVKKLLTYWPFFCG